MRWLSAFAVAGLMMTAAVFVGSVAAQEASPEDLYVDETAGQDRTIFQSLRDFGSFGGSVGIMRVFGGDLGADAKIKPILLGTFRYRFSDRWIGVADFGFGWNDFDAKEDTVLTFTFGTLGVVRTVAQPWGLQLRAGLGAGFYRWNYKWHGHSIRDPQTFRFYKGLDPGAYFGLEAERRITRYVTLTGTLRDHFVFTADEEQFEVLFDKNHSFVDLRIGVNYHFSPYEGMLWERKRTQKIRLESGKGGK